MNKTTTQVKICPNYKYWKFISCYDGPEFILEVAEKVREIPC